MATVSIRRQGGAAIMTIPADVMKRLKVEVGSSLELDVSEGAFTARPTPKVGRRRYTLCELMRGATPEAVRQLNDDTAWSREGEAAGREL